MKLDLGENYKIETDGLNAILKKKCIVSKKVEEGQEPEFEEVFRTVGYFASIKQALLNVLNIELLEDEVIEDVQEVLNRITQYESLVSSINI